MSRLMWRISVRMLDFKAWEDRQCLIPNAEDVDENQVLGLIWAINSHQDADPSTHEVLFVYVSRDRSARSNGMAFFPGSSIPSIVEISSNSGALDNRHLLRYIVVSNTIYGKGERVVRSRFTDAVLSRSDKKAGQAYLKVLAFPLSSYSDTTISPP